MTKQLEEEIEQIKSQLAEAEKEEVKEEVIEEAEEPEAETKEEVEPPVEEEKKEPEEKPVDDVGGARLRRENAALKKRLEEAEAKKADPVEAIEEVQAPADDPLLRSVKERELVNQATQEFTGYVEEFRARAPVDFQEIADEYEKELYRSIRVQNPRLSPSQLVEKTQRTILQKAGQYVKGGFNPAEEMYHEAKALGIKPAPKVIEVETKEQLKPDLSKIAANMSRNAGTAGAKGAGEKGQLTAAAASELPAHEWAKLPVHERKKIMDSLKTVA